MPKSGTVLRKILVSLAGFPVIIIGIVLLPLPGPGLLVIIFGLVILSTEFEWSKKYLVMARTRVQKLYDKAKGRKSVVGSHESKSKED